MAVESEGDAAEGGAARRGVNSTVGVIPVMLPANPVLSVIETMPPVVLLLLVGLTTVANNVTVVPLTAPACGHRARSSNL